MPAMSWKFGLFRQSQEAATVCARQGLHEFHCAAILEVVADRDRVNLLVAGVVDRDLPPYQPAKANIQV